MASLAPHRINIKMSYFSILSDFLYVLTSSWINEAHHFIILVQICRIHIIPVYNSDEYIQYYGKPEVQINIFLCTQEFFKGKFYVNFPHQFLS